MADSGTLKTEQEILTQETSEDASKVQQIPPRPPSLVIENVAFTNFLDTIPSSNSISESGNNYEIDCVGIPGMACVKTEFCVQIQACEETSVTSNKPSTHKENCTIELSSLVYVRNNLRKNAKVQITN